MQQKQNSRVFLETFLSHIVLLGLFLNLLIFCLCNMVFDFVFMMCVCVCMCSLSYFLVWFSYFSCLVDLFVSKHLDRLESGENLGED